MSNQSGPRNILLISALYEEGDIEMLNFSAGMVSLLVHLYWVAQEIDLGTSEPLNR